jgi:hypothetical protein
MRLAWFPALAIVALLAFAQNSYPQGNQCRTSPVGTSSPNCASEAFVTNSAGSGNVQSIGGQKGVVGLDSSLEAKTGNAIGIKAPVSIANGGTGGTTLPTARSSLGVPGSTFQTLTAGSYTLSSADSGKTIFADASGGGVTVTLPAANLFGVGQVTMKKVDQSSNLVQFSGTFEESQTSMPLSLEGDVATMASDGTNWKLIMPGLATLRHNPFVAEHTITIPSYQIDRTYNGYVMIVDAATAGAPVLMVLPAITSAAFSHQTFTVVITKFDSGSNNVTVVPFEAGTLHWSSSTYILSHQYQSAIFWTDGARWLILSQSCEAGC